MQNAYIGRKEKKRDFRKLWVTRVNAASREHDIRYADLVDSMAKCDIKVNRKVLSELAMHEPRSFEALAKFATGRANEKRGLASLL